MNQTTIFDFFASLNAGTDTGTIRKVATAPVCAVAESQGLVSREALARMNQKALKHTARSLNFIATGDLSMLDVLTATGVLLAMLNDEGTRAQYGDVHFALSGVGREDSKPLPAIPSPSLKKALGRKSVGTVKTQTSRTMGKRGILTALGATVNDAHGASVANKAHPFVRAFAARLASVSQSALCEKMGVDPLTGDLTAPATVTE